MFRGVLGVIRMVDGVAHNGWAGLVVVVVALEFLYAFGTTGGGYVRRLMALGRQRKRIGGCADGILDWRANVMLGVAVVLSVGFCVFVCMVRCEFVVFGFLEFVVSLMVVVAFFALKFWTAKVVGAIFRLEIDVAVMKVLAVYVFFGFFAFVLSIAVLLGISVQLMCILFVITLLCRVIAEFIALVKNFFVKTSSLFYIFLYLCAAEILPLLVAFRLVNTMFN